MTDSNSFILKRIGTYELKGNRLGKGNFAYVELAINRVTKSKVAIKVIDTRKIKDDYVRKNVLREASLLKKLRHPNIVRLYETLKQRSLYCIVTEYVPGGELLSLLRGQNDSKLSESQARPIMRQLVSALQHMHEQGIVHRDLKMENILLDETKKNITIVDFGLSNICLKGELLKTQCGSPEYAAPELFRKGCQYGTEVDLWSLGIIMYGIVVGRLPFRSPHAGSKGRSDLVDQMSRGLSIAHNKYLVKLTPKCRDLLRKLIEPNPQMRWPLLDVMAHPWITLQGTKPLFPYSVKPPDSELRDKVLQKTSQLLKLDKSRIALHVQRNKYDAISGVYHLLLDEELKKMSKERDHEMWATTEPDTEDGSIIRVSITAAGNQDVQTDTSKTESEVEIKYRSKVCDRPAELDCEPAQGEKQIAFKERDSQVLVRGPSKGLQVKGIRVCRTEMRLPKDRACPKTRPSTASAKSSYARNTEKQNIPMECLHSRLGTVCRAGTTPKDSKFDNKVRGRRVVMSPRVRQKPKGAVAQWALKLQPLEWTEKGDGPLEADGENNAGGGIEMAEEESNHTNPKTDELKSPAQRENCVDIKIRGLTQENEQTAHSNTADASIKVNPKQNFVLSSHASSTLADSETKAPPSSLALQSMDRSAFPVKTSQFVNMMEINRYHPKSAKHYTRDKSCTGESKSVPRQGMNVDKIEDMMDSCSFSDAYQSYVQRDKQQHRRLSIMQAHDILQHESKFHAKYGRRPTSENKPTATITDTSEMQRSDEQGERATKPPVVRFSYGGMGNNSSVSSRKKAENWALTKETIETKIVVDPPEDHGRATSTTADRILHEPIPKPECVEESRANDHKEDRTANGQSTPRQEGSMKRQREKEQIEGYERERVKFQQELEDKERQRMVQDYLGNVYSQHHVPALQDKTEHNQRCYRITKHHRPHTLLARPSLKSNAPPPQIVGKSTPLIHHYSTRDSMQRKIAFKHDSGSQKSSGVRYQNDWSSTAFTDYINSTKGTAAEKGENDNDQLNDASSWLHQHLYGVVDETTARNDLHNYKQIISRST